MVKLIRLDERLIHGQVAAKWLKAVDVDRVLVADDVSAADPIATKTLLMAVAGTNKKTVVKSVKDTITILTDPRCVDLKVFVVTNRIDSLLCIMEAVRDIEAVNIGNYGIIGDSDEPRKQYYDRMYLNSKEHEWMKQVAAAGVPAYYQKTPETAKVELAAIL